MFVTYVRKGSESSARKRELAFTGCANMYCSNWTKPRDYFGVKGHASLFFPEDPELAQFIHTKLKEIKRHYKYTSGEVYFVKLHIQRSFQEFCKTSRPNAAWLRVEEDAPAVVERQFWIRDSQFEDYANMCCETHMQKEAGIPCVSGHASLYFPACLVDFMEGKVATFNKSNPKTVAECLRSVLISKIRAEDPDFDISLRFGEPPRTDFKPHPMVHWAKAFQTGPPVAYTELDRHRFEKVCYVKLKTLENWTLFPLPHTVAFSANYVGNPKKKITVVMKGPGKFDAKKTMDGWPVESHALESWNDLSRCLRQMVADV